MLNSRFSTSMCVLLGASLTAPSIMAETSDANATNATNASSVSAAVTQEDSSPVSTVVNPVAKDNVTKTATKAAIEDAHNNPSPIALPSSDAKPNLLTRIANHIFFWRKPKSKYSVAVEPTISVTVNGAPEALETNLKETLKQITVDEFEDFQSDLPRLRGLAVDAAQAVGYYTATFHFNKTSRDHLLVDVVPDTPVTVSSQKITITGEGETDKAYIHLQATPDLKVGDTLNHGEYEKTKARILNIATDHGYFQGHYLAHDIQVTLPPKTADITLSYDTGARYAFGDVTYKNSNPTKKLPLKPSVLAALQPFKSGEPYDAASLAKLSRNLQDTRFFNNVQVDAPTPDVVPDTIKPLDSSDSTIQSPESGSQGDGTTPNTITPASESSQKTDVDSKSQLPVTPTTSPVQSKDDHTQSSISEKPSIPVVVTLNADNPNNVEAGIGYGTDTGPRIRTQYRRALVNDSGDSFDANAELSQNLNSLDLRYNIPMSNPLSDVVSVFGGYAEQKLNETNGLTVDTKTTTLGVQRTINPVGEWQRTYSLRYRNDELANNAINVDPSLLPAPFNIQGASSHQQALLAGFGLNQVITKGGVNPTSGYRQYYQIDVGSRSAYSDANMIILRAGLRALQTFADNHQIVISTDVGKILTSNFNQVPYNLRFFAGGDQSIRGYDYKSLSPLVNGYEVGGQNLIVGSLEYNYLFKPKLRGAVFVDAGNAYDNQFKTATKVGAGFGIRYASPVGPIRIDLAAGVSETSPPIRLVFYIGAPL
ncbi:MAG: outer membrane protein assembly factor [Gammaproteobacteria bacterium]|nr:outer membrane protein assembly factor [Gammaproteobacteria bacterium]